jgi:hypothetical protein
MRAFGTVRSPPRVPFRRPGPVLETTIPVMHQSAETYGAPLPRERRLLADRRRNPTRIWASLRFGGRRRGFRREGEARNSYVDRPSRDVVALCLITVVLSVLDALFTLLHLEGGGREVNPIMRLAIGGGVSLFLTVKIGLTGFGVLFLAVHEHFRMSRVALHGIALAYSALLAYHSVLYVAARI